MTSVSARATGKAGETPASGATPVTPAGWPSTSPTSPASSSVPVVTIRYWASARAAAGCDSERLPGRDVGELLEAAAAAHTGLGGVLGVCTVLLDGRAVTASAVLSDGATIEVLPPFAGG